MVKRNQTNMQTYKNWTPLKCKEQDSLYLLSNTIFETAYY